MLAAYPLTWVALFAASSTYWFLPAGLRLAILWMLPRRYWWKMALAEWSGMVLLGLFRESFDTPLAVVLSTLLPWCVYAGSVRLASQQALRSPTLESMPLMLACGLLAALANAMGLSVIQWLDGGATHALSGALLFSFALGDFVGIVIVAPLLIAFRDHNGRWRQSTAPFLAEGLVLVPLSLALGAASLPLPAAARYPLPFAILPLFWLAFTHGWRAGLVAFALLSTGVYLFDRSLFAIWPPGQLQVLLAASGAAALLLGISSDTLRTQARALAATVEMLSMRTKALSEAANRLTSKEEDERRRIGAELHDQIGQDMTAIATRLRVTLRTRDNPALLQSGLEALGSLVADAHSHLRDVINHLHPLALDRFGLARALADGPLAEMLRDNDVDFACVVEGEVDRLPLPVATAIYRICQEAATNSARHGCGNRVGIHLSVTPRDEDAEVVLRIEDEAGPLALLPDQPGHGLQGIRDRANAMGADYYFHHDSGRPRHWLQLRVPK